MKVEGFVWFSGLSTTCAPRNLPMITRSSFMTSIVKLLRNTLTQRWVWFINFVVFDLILYSLSESWGFCLVSYANRLIKLFDSFLSFFVIRFCLLWRRSMMSICCGSWLRDGLTIKWWFDGYPDSSTILTVTSLLGDHFHRWMKLAWLASVTGFGARSCYVWLYLASVIF